MRGSRTRLFCHVICLCELTLNIDPGINVNLDRIERTIIMTFYGDVQKVTFGIVNGSSDGGL